MVRNRAYRILILLIAALALEGCATTRPARSGRSGLFDRGRDQTFSFLQKPSSVAGSSTASPRPEARDPAATVKDHRSLDPVRISAARRRASNWASPLQSAQVTSHFGRRGEDFHEGVDFRAKPGTPVFAVDAGRVLYADSRIGGYGRMIVIRHPSGLATVYAHNSRLLVRRGQTVRRAQRIALSGQTGRSTGPHVHFEIRDGFLALDPLRVLPLRGTGSRLALSGSRRTPASSRAPLAKRD